MNNQKGFTLVEMLTVVFFVGVLAIVSTVAYIAIHFIAKFW